MGLKSLDIVNKRVNYYNDGVRTIHFRIEDMLEIQKDLEILELVRGKSFFFHLSKQELKKVNKWLEENENDR